MVVTSTATLHGLSSVRAGQTEGYTGCPVAVLRDRDFRCLSSRVCPQHLQQHLCTADAHQMSDEWMGGWVGGCTDGATQPAGGKSPRLMQCSGSPSPSFALTCVTNPVLLPVTWVPKDNPSVLPGPSPLLRVQAGLCPTGVPPDLPPTCRAAARG